MKLVISTTLAVVVAATAHAESWEYVATLPTQMRVYVDRDSVRYTANHLHPLGAIIQARVSTGRSGEEADLVQVEVACGIRGIRTRAQVSFVPVPAGDAMARLITGLCDK